MTHLSGPRFWLFQLNTETTYWIQTLATLAWEESSVKYRITWSASSPIAVGPYDRPQRKYCTMKREMLAAVSMCIQFRSYLRGAKFTLRTDHKSHVWLHRFKDTEGMMARWLHTLQQFQFYIVHHAGRDHGNTDGLSRAPTSPCRQCTRTDAPPWTRPWRCLTNHLMLSH